MSDLHRPFQVSNTVHIRSSHDSVRHSRGAAPRERGVRLRDGLRHDHFASSREQSRSSQARRWIPRTTTRRMTMMITVAKTTTSACNMPAHARGCAHARARGRNISLLSLFLLHTPRSCGPHLRALPWAYAHDKGRWPLGAMVGDACSRASYLAWSSSLPVKHCNMSFSPGALPIP